MDAAYVTFAEALESTGFADPADLAANGLTICGVALSEADFRYWAAPADQSDDDYHNQAFEIRHGRPISEAELWYRDQAKRMRQPA